MILLTLKIVFCVALALVLIPILVPVIWGILILAVGAVAVTVAFVVAAIASIPSAIAALWDELYKFLQFRRRVVVVEPMVRCRTGQCVTDGWDTKCLKCGHDPVPNRVIQRGGGI
jgi:hypothetical protein